MARAGATEPTEAPSARRIREARRRGLVAQSRDLSDALALVALVVVLVVAAPRGLAELGGLMRSALTASAGDAAARAALGARALDVASALTLLSLAPVLVVGVLAAVLQTGGLFSWSAAAPDLSRLSPGAALARLASPESLGAVGRALAKAALVTLAASLVLGPLFRRLPALAGVEPRAMVRLLGSGGRTLGTAVATALLAWGVLDWVLARRRHRLSLMMTRQEAIRDRREAEGDALVKAERLRRHRAALAEPPYAATARELRDVDFVVTDGLGLAVAVRHDRRGLRAPVVEARGDGLGAAALERTAHEARVPVHVDAGLAQALGTVPLGGEIPVSTFQAVAELLLSPQIDG